MSVTVNACILYIELDDNTYSGAIIFFSNSRFGLAQVFSRDYNIQHQSYLLSWWVPLLFWLCRLSSACLPYCIVLFLSCFVSLLSCLLLQFQMSISTGTNKFKAKLNCSDLILAPNPLHVMTDSCLMAPDFWPIEMFCHAFVAAAFSWCLFWGVSDTVFSYSFLFRWNACSVRFKSGDWLG